MRRICAWFGSLALALCLLAALSASAGIEDDGGDIRGGGIANVIRQSFTYADFTDGGGASGTLVLAKQIPDGAVVTQAVLYGLTGFTGDVSATITVGDGTDVDRYNTGTPSVFTTNPSGVALGAVSGTAWHDAAKSVTITITEDSDWGDVTAGAATIAIYYYGPN